METDMTDIFMVLAGCLGMAIAVVHGVLGERKVVGPIEGVPSSAKRVMQAIMFLSAVYWFAGGAVLVASPFYFDANTRLVAAIIVGAVFFSGALANFWATRGRHFGWMLLTGATALTYLGAQ
jgi:hypothetical protein